MKRWGGEKTPWPMWRGIEVTKTEMSGGRLWSVHQLTDSNIYQEDGENGEKKGKYSIAYRFSLAWVRAISPCKKVPLLPHTRIETVHPSACPWMARTWFCLTWVTEQTLSPLCSTVRIVARRDPASFVAGWKRPTIAEKRWSSHSGRGEACRMARFF